MHHPRWQRLLGGVAVAAVLAGTLPAALAAQVLQGYLRDSGTDEAIPAATIMLVDTDSVSVDAATTDSAGYFSVSATERGEYRLLARRIGYPGTISTALGLGVGDTLQVEFRISAGAVLLDPVVVTGRRRPPPPDIAAFYDRAERAIFGTFLTRSEIEQAHAFRASDLLRRIPGVQVLPRQFGASGVRIRGCSPALIVDGVHARFEQSIDHLVAPLELEGLEVYRSASEVPVEYGGLQGSCGAILIWTRRGP